jgi:hypothetical protein
VKEAEMFQIPEARAIVKVSLLLLVTLGVGSCSGGDSVQSLNLNPHVSRPKTEKKTKLVPCDTKINADINTGGVDLDAAFLCENDTVTWQIPNRHTFHIKFDSGSPFVGGKSEFTDTDASGTVIGTYKKLTVYKYTITVDSMKPVDPQVVGGGNP